MGRPPWATPEQTEFLESKVPSLEKEKQNYGLKPFYVQVTKEFLKRWPSIPVPDGKSSDAKLKELADERKGEVSQIIWFVQLTLTGTLPANLPVVQTPQTS